MPSGTSKNRTFRCDDALWYQAGDKAKAEGVELSTVLRELLADWLAGSQPATIKAADSL